jgi:hypothetical protein
VLLVQLPAHHGILLVLAATGTGALLGWSVKLAKASSSGESITRNDASSAAAGAGANPRRDESNPSFTESGAVTSHAGSSTPTDRTPPSVPSEVGSGSSCFLTTTGAKGACIDTSACPALGGHAPASAPCQGPANENLFPTGWRPMPQARVTAEMGAWATTIVESKATYPMGSTTTQLFGDTEVMARVEWHPANLRHNTIHRGVTLYRAAMDNIAMGELPTETDR